MAVTNPRMNDAPRLPLPVAMVLERAIAAGLALDGDTRKRLQALDGRAIRLAVHEPTIDIVMIVDAGRVRVPSVHDGDVDVTVSGSARAMASLARGNDALHRGEVTLSGQVGLGLAMRQIIAGIDPEWQEWLAPVLGDALVHRLDRLLGAASGWLSRTRRSLAEDGRDWLEDEVSLVASPVQVERFTQEVDALRGDADRLEARLNRLQARAVADAGVPNPSDDTAPAATVSPSIGSGDAPAS